MKNLSEIKKWFQAIRAGLSGFIVYPFTGAGVAEISWDEPTGDLGRYFGAVGAALSGSCAKFSQEHKYA